MARDMPRPRRTLFALAFAALLLGSGPVALTACTETTGRGESRVRLATTTSTENSGLLGWLLPVFEEEHDCRIEVIAVGSGAALRLGESGDADVLVVHARDREDAFMESGRGAVRHDLMWNDFVIVGPAADPAGVGGTRDAPAALRRIHERGARFVSRGDDSGTHIREQQLWATAGLRPTPAGGYVEAGTGMGACLRMASELGAYTLADRGTWLAHRSGLALTLHVAGDGRLRNPYGVILVQPRTGDPPPAARTFVEWLVSPAGQARIDAFRVGDDPLFRSAFGDGPE